MFITLFHQKRVAYVYKAKTEVRGTNVRVIWGFVYMQCPSIWTLMFTEITQILTGA